jgi:uncharacterized SAM-binding protein YcdF (DUF218 family)
LSTCEVIEDLPESSRAQRAVYLATIVATAVWLGAALDVPAMLVAPLEHRFSRAEILDAEGITGIIALGGGAERIREADRLARRYPHLRVFVSGPRLVDLKLLGRDIDSARVVIETRSQNTHENAVFAKAALTKPGERWLLVTSASHMPRAMGAFRQNSFPVEPWPVYDRWESKPLYVVAQHEWLGLIAYHLLGRTSELFPAPSEGKLHSTARVTGGAREEGNDSWQLAAAVKQGGN